MFYFLVKIAATFSIIFLPTVKRKTVKSCELKLPRRLMKQKCKITASCKVNCPKRYNYEGKLSTNYILENIFLKYTFDF